ncbi:MAG TPA: hypothetical protein VG227_03740 [Caulobacteraceae bacterium]|nr:hypothetical protein [Caulobacteraceae bacterium]
MKVAILSACLCLPMASICGVALAGTISTKEAQQRVADAERENTKFMAKFPALQPVENAVKDDCAAKAAGQTSSGAFCECAAAVTMELWRSGIDAKMLQRLTDYINSSGASAASDFTTYQGPELYAPLCLRAGGKR